MVSKFIKNLRKRSVQVRELIDASYHESGHTIYGLLKFLKVCTVSIGLNKKKTGGEGITIYESVFDFDEEFCDSVLLNYCIESEISLSYAGLGAERIFYKNISGLDHCFSFLRDGSSEDNLSASDLINKYNIVPPGKKRFNYKKKMIKETTETLLKYWEDVVIVANALFQKKRLYYSDLKSLLLKKSSNKSFWREQFRNIEYISNNRGSIDIKKIKSIVSA